MYCVGKVHRCRTGRKVHHIALRGKGEDLLGGQVVAKRVEELIGIGGFLLPVQKLAHPRHLVHFFLVTRVLALGFFVAPVSSHTEFGVVVHLVGTYLDFQGSAAICQHRGMQGLIHAESRRGNIVLEAPRQCLVDRVHHTDSGITAIDVLDQNADSYKVEDLREVTAAHDHLLINGPVMLWAAHNLGFNAVFLQRPADLANDLLQRAVARGGAICHHPYDFVVLLRIQDGKGQIFQLPLHAGHAEAVS